MKHVFIMNDTKKNHDFESTIREVMQEKNYTIIYTHSIQEVAYYVKQYKEPTRFYSVGGDGSANSIMQELVHSDHQLVIIPLGTGNDFVKMLTKLKDPKEILKRSLEAPVKKIDTIMVNNRYYINSACFGVDALIGNEVHNTPNIPMVKQSQSYVISILQHVFHYDFGEVELLNDHQTLYKGAITLLTINNGRYYGGGFEITPDADICDGFMNIVICDKVKKNKIPYLISTVLRKKHYIQKEVHCFKEKEVVLKTMNTGNLDGDEMKVEGIYHFKVIPLSLNLVMYD